MGELIYQKISDRDIVKGFSYKSTPYKIKRFVSHPIFKFKKGSQEIIKKSANEKKKSQNIIFKKVNVRKKAVKEIRKPSAQVVKNKYKFISHQK